MQKNLYIVAQLKEAAAWHRERAQFWAASARYWKAMGDEPESHKRCLANAQYHRCKAQWAEQRAAS